MFDLLHDTMVRMSADSGGAEEQRALDVCPHTRAHRSRYRLCIWYLRRARAFGKVEVTEVGIQDARQLRILRCALICSSEPA